MDVSVDLPKPEDVAHHFACTFLITTSGKLVGHLRDDKPMIDNPGKVGLFGGSVEPGEDPLTAAWRELVLEETNLQLQKSDFHHFVDAVTWRTLTSEWEVAHLYYVYIEDSVLETMEVYEGQGWVYISDPRDPKLATNLQPFMEQITAQLSLSL
jgi:8-oxo-dGTP pyrophosphatase MutT (NUDIX family)